MSQPINLEAFFADVDERASEAQRLAETEISMAYLRGVVTGCFSCILFAGIAYAAWRIFHG